MGLQRSRLRGVVERQFRWLCWPAYDIWINNILYNLYMIIEDSWAMQRDCHKLTGQAPFVSRNCFFQRVPPPFHTQRGSCGHVSKLIRKIVPSLGGLTSINHHQSQQVWYSHRIPCWSDPHAEGLGVYFFFFRYVSSLGLCGNTAGSGREFEHWESFLCQQVWCCSGRGHWDLFCCCCS